jgi:hypothetical protein
MLSMSLCRLVEINLLRPITCVPCPELVLVQHCQLQCSKIAEAEAAVSVNETKWLVMHMHVQLRLDELHCQLQCMSCLTKAPVTEECHPLERSKRSKPCSKATPAPMLSNAGNSLNTPAVDETAQTIYMHSVKAVTVHRSNLHTLC